MTDTVLAQNMPNVHSLEYPNIPIHIPIHLRGRLRVSFRFLKETLNLPRKWKQHIQIQTPERAYGQAHSRGGEVSTFTEVGTGLSWADHCGPHRLWLPKEWLDWSVIHSRDSDGEKGT